MADVKLAQHEADALLAMEKHRVSDRMCTLPAGGHKEVIDLISADRRERFILDLYRGRRKRRKFTFQNRARQTSGLFVLTCMDGIQILTAKLSKHPIYMCTAKDVD